jgi:hypothetical protein
VPRVDGTNNPISRTEIALNMHVDFRYQLDAQGNDQLPISFPIVEVVEDSLGGMDYAIVRLANNPGLTFELASVSPADAAEGDMLCIMGHPSGVPKRIEAGPLSRFGPISIEYDDIDTRPVSSGSGILADATGQIVGVHTNGGCCEITEEEDCLEPEPGRNTGVRISALLQQSPLLRNLAAGGTPTA